MTEPSITQYITDTFDDVQVEIADGSSFFFCGPARNLPFATLVATDNYDSISNLGRPSVFRLNIGIGKPNYLSLFGQQPSEAGHDFTALDRLMPHPVYGNMFWICVLNPSDATFQKVKPLLAEAYERSAGKHARARPESEP